MRIFYCLLVTVIVSACHENRDGNLRPAWLENSVKKMQVELEERYGKTQSKQIHRGLSQIAAFWMLRDGNQEEFETFVLNNYAGENSIREAMFGRFQEHLEIINGHMDRIVLDFRRQADLDIGIILPFDELFAAYNPGAHVNDDFFDNKLAFIILLNFPQSNLSEMATDGYKWTRRQWAEQRLASNFAGRIPADITLEISRVSSESENYIANYNIWMHHVLDQKGQRLFPPKLRLLSHWNLRDEIRAQYTTDSDGLARQRLIQRVMERIIDQSIPQAVINNPRLDWYPISNKVKAADVQDYETTDPFSIDISEGPEPNTRYDMLRRNFLGQKAADQYWPIIPNFIQRRFELTRQIPEERVNELFDKLLSSDNFKLVAEIIKKRLGRNLEPFDIWYNGFKSRSKYTEEQLNNIVSKKYPSPESFEDDIPRILKELGFNQDHINEIANLIVVDPARGSGHAWGAKMRGARAHLRTRVNADGMDYKGYNIAIHELGHNVEQVISLNYVDYTLLEGVPNTAFTEAMAFLFQARDLQLLGLEGQNDMVQVMRNLSDFWATCEIAAVALVDNAIWHWMYDNPEARAEDIREATIRIAKEMWNRYFADIFGISDVTLFAIYSHMISYPLYLTDYPLGHIIAYQIEEKIGYSSSIGPEFYRMAKIGNIAPDYWMLQATGDKINIESLQNSTTYAINKLR